MSAPLTSVQWLVRAEDARLDAAATNDPQAKRMMLVMAAGCEKLAAHAMGWSDWVCRTRGRELRPRLTGTTTRPRRCTEGDRMSDIESPRAAIADQQAAADYPTLQRRYAAAEPLFITCMCSSFASILSAAVISEALVAEVNNRVASDWEGRTSESDPTTPRWSPP